MAEERLGGSYDALVEQHGDDPEPEIAEQLEAMSARIDALSEGNTFWTPEDKARSGAILSIDHDGTLAIERGLIRPEDRQQEAASAGAEEGEAPSPALSSNTTGLSDRLVEDLTAHRTAALRVMLARGRLFTRSIIRLVSCTNLEQMPADLVCPLHNSRLTSMGQVGLGSPPQHFNSQQRIFPM